MFFTYYFTHLKVSSHQLELLVFLSSDSKSPQVPRTLLSILADLNCVVFWIVSTFPLISKSPSPCTNPVVTLLSAPITIGNTVTSMFHSFYFQFLLQGVNTYVAFGFPSVLPCGQPERQSPLIFVCISLVLVVWSRLDDPFVWF